MRIAVFGVGGVGGYFGGRLAQAGEEVIFIARGKHLQAMREHGLRVDSINGDFSVQPVQASDDPAQVGPVDLILVGVKAWQITEAAESMRPMVGPDTVIIPLQNGVEAPKQLASVLGEGPVLGGLCGVMAFIAGPGHIRHAGIDPFVRFGELDNRRSERVEAILDMFSRAQGLKADIPEDIHVAMWQKFLMITATSGVGSVTRAPFGAYLSLPGTRRMLEQVLEEVHAVANARGVALPAESIGKTMALFDKLPASGTASMQRDIMSGLPSELEIQNGAVVRLGREAGVATPVNEFIYHSLLPLEMRARGQLQFDI